MTAPFVCACVARFQATTRVYLRRADAFVIVYDVTSRDSFRSVGRWLALAKVGGVTWGGVGDRDPPIIPE